MGLIDKLKEWIFAPRGEDEILDMSLEIRELRGQIAELELERLAAVTRGDRMASRLLRVRRLLREACTVSDEFVVRDEGGDP